MFARDPRDISRIYFYDPDDDVFLEIGYLDTSRGPISLWELRRANQKLMEEGRGAIDERRLFEKHFELMENAKQAAKKTKSARRQVQRSAIQQAGMRTQEKPISAGPADIEDP